MYVRFETRCGRGLFHEVARFKRTIGRGAAPRVPRAERAEFLALQDWLGEHTPAPARRVYRDERRREFTTWFHAGAVEHVRRAWLLYELLARNGSTVRPLRSCNPGRIVFTDEVQAVVIPYRGRAGRALPWWRDRRTVRRWIVEA
jgi:hypothetical protein